MNSGSLYWDVVYAGRISEARTQSMQAYDHAVEAEDQIRHLEDSFNRLALLCHAMWTLVQEKTNLTEDDLRKRVQKLDLTDGRLEGKVGEILHKCQKCGHIMSSRHRRCLYCGAEQLTQTQFNPLT